MPDTHLPFRTATELAAAYRRGEVSPVSVTEALLARIAALDPALHAFIAVTPERARAEARAAEVELRAGHDRGPLHGVPYVAKDLFDVKGLPTTAGTRVLAGNVAGRDGAVVRKLAAAGMVLVGKTHTVQFAFGGVGINHDHGTPHNPWHREPRAPGGSSSGSAVAVAAGLAPMGLGTDTGGSVRLPAGLCGIVGLKTTVGRVSRAGVYPLSHTLDSVGPLTRSVEDAALVYDAIQGPDAEDDSTVGVAPHDPLRDLDRGARGLRLAFAETVFFDEVEPEVDRAVREAGRVLAGLGAHVGTLAVPEVGTALAEEKRVLVVGAEACAVNARLLDHHFDELDPVVARRMATGRTLSAPDYFTQIRKWRALRESAIRTLADVDALLVPTAPLTAKPLATIDASYDTYASYNGRYLRNTTLGNVLGWCGVSVPCGLDRDGLPIGLMVYAKPFQEDVALRVARAYEKASGWAGRQPDLGWAEPTAR
jgi:aspartyl-tRNA(Asn)/glutamyl-tRNA(Gln) amidotransferase subunit A